MLHLGLRMFISQADRMLKLTDAGSFRNVMIAFVPLQMCGCVFK